MTDKSQYALWVPLEESLCHEVPGWQQGNPSLIFLKIHKARDEGIVGLPEVLASGRRQSVHMWHSCSPTDGVLENIWSLGSHFSIHSRLLKLSDFEVKFKSRNISFSAYEDLFSRFESNPESTIRRNFSSEGIFTLSPGNCALALIFQNV